MNLLMNLLFLMLPTKYKKTKNPEQKLKAQYMPDPLHADFVLIANYTKMLGGLLVLS